MRKTGFTLIELMIVIAIIAILASILVPNFSKSREKANLEACNSNLKSIATAFEMYAADNNGKYGADVMSSGFPIASTCYLVTSGYLKSAPKCPLCPASVAYGYRMSANFNRIYCDPSWNNTKSPHTGLTPYYPAYYMEKGLVVK